MGDDEREVRIDKVGRQRRPRLEMQTGLLLQAIVCCSGFLLGVR